MMISNFIKIIFILNFFFLIKNFFNKKYINILNESCFFFTNKNKKKSFFFIFIFFITFVIGFRFLRLFFINQNLFFDLSYWLDFFFKINFNLIDKIIFIIFILNVFFLFKIYFVYFIKINYLRIHYYFLMRFTIYNNIIFFLENIDYYFYILSGKNKRYFAILFLILNYFLRFFFFILIIKNIIFDNMIIYIGFIPFYASYYFFVNIYRFFKSMERDFEHGSLQKYYPKHFCITKLGFKKLSLYHNKLITNNSKYHFGNSIIYSYDLLNLIPRNWIFFCYKNNSPILEISAKNKPIIINSYF